MRNFFLRWIDWLTSAARRARASRAPLSETQTELDSAQTPAPQTRQGPLTRPATASEDWEEQNFEFTPTVRVGQATRAQATERQTPRQQKNQTERQIERQAADAEARAVGGRSSGAQTQGPSTPASLGDNGPTPAAPARPRLKKPGAAAASMDNRLAEALTQAQAEKKSAQESRRAMQSRALEWAEQRWGKLLDALRFEPASLGARWKAAQREGLSEPERKLAPQNAKKFLDGLLIARQWDLLDALWSHLERAAFRAHLQSKAPSLARWAAGQIEDSDLLPTKNPDLIDWARQKGAFEPERLRASHVADAVAVGDLKRAREAITDSGQASLGAPDASQILAAMARKKELGGMAGLGETELAALWEALGGAQGQGMESLAGLPPSELAWAFAKLLDAMEETEAAEIAVLEQAAKINSKRARELIARVIATQAASQERIGLLRGAIDRAPALMGMTRAQAIDARSPAVVVRVGGMRARAERGQGVSLSEAAALSGSKEAARALESMGAKAADPQALKELVKSASKDVRRQVARSQLAAEHATAWRQTLAEWKSGALGATQVSDLENRAREKFRQAQREKARAGSGNRSPKA